MLTASLCLTGKFAMAAVVGSPAGRLASFCRRGEVEVAAQIAPGQILAAGRAEALGSSLAKVTPNGLRVQLLSIRWPLHTSLMQPVAEALARSAAGTDRLRRFHYPVYSALHGTRIATPREGRELLVEHLHRPQRFDLAFAATRTDGLIHCVELGPGSTMARAVRWLTHGEAERC